MEDPERLDRSGENKRSCSFFARPKNEPKKGARSLVPTLSGFPVLLAKAETRENSLRSDSSRLFIGFFCDARLRDMGLNTAPSRGLPDATRSAGARLTQIIKTENFC